MPPSQSNRGAYKEVNCHSACSVESTGHALQLVPKKIVKWTICSTEYFPNPLSQRGVASVYWNGKFTKEMPLMKKSCKIICRVIPYLKKSKHRHNIAISKSICVHTHTHTHTNSKGKTWKDTCQTDNNSSFGKSLGRKGLVKRLQFYLYCFNFCRVCNQVLLVNLKNNVQFGNGCPIWRSWIKTPLALL